MEKIEEKKLYVVGIGPGSGEEMTGRARRILEECQVIAGYTVYTDLVREDFPDKEYLTTSMRQEVERCRLALERASEGARVAMICSGDSGVYGMAGLILTMAPEFPDVRVEIVPGVTAALSGAALLGAPLGHDFAVISLSDLLTPAEVIEKRLRCAAEGDFAICLYNPSSKKRSGYLKWAVEILLQYKPAETVCGLVKNIDRDGQSVEILNLESLGGSDADMFTTVFVGNNNTMVAKGRMVTPRGYKNV